jgi:hypothetical protein
VQGAMARSNVQGPMFKVQCPMPNVQSVGGSSRFGTAKGLSRMSPSSRAGGKTGGLAKILASG